MMRALVYLALALALSGCIDNRLSLGRHEAPLPGQGDGDAPLDMDAAFMEPAMPTGGSGGTGGTSGMTGGAPFEPPPDAGPPRVDANVEPEPATPCTDQVSMSATLECAVNNRGGPGGRPDSMITMTTFSFEPDLRAGREGLGRLTGMLAFEAFTATFNGRVEGTVDCERGMLFARIFDGEVTPEGGPAGPFYGDLTGFVDPLSGAIDGMWWHGPDPITPICVGSWTASPL